jgi:hypothetical protein
MKFGRFNIPVSDLISSINKKEIIKIINKRRPMISFLMEFFVSKSLILPPFTIKSTSILYEIIRYYDSYKEIFIYLSSTLFHHTL